MPVRLIPAHAGKTRRRHAHPRRSQAHPRSRGENEAGDEKGSTFDGSSPLTRGKRCSGARRSTRPWLIPAHAGKTFGARSWMGISTAHPRSRGENLSISLRNSSKMGSSPLTRGKPQARSNGACHDRLIPAHAGKTAQARGRRECPQAHPRSRGENGTPSTTSRGPNGSSPLTRGKPVTSEPSGDGTRLIPAHAGKTQRSSLTSSPRPAHPRSRGENTS